MYNPNGGGSDSGQTGPSGDGSAAAGGLSGGSTDGAPSAGNADGSTATGTGPAGGTGPNGAPADPTQPRSEVPIPDPQGRDGRPEVSPDAGGPSSGAAPTPNTSAILEALDITFGSLLGIYSFAFGPAGEGVLVVIGEGLGLAGAVAGIGVVGAVGLAVGLGALFNSNLSSNFASNILNSASGTLAFAKPSGLVAGLGSAATGVGDPQRVATVGATLESGVDVVRTFKAGNIPGLADSIYGFGSGVHALTKESAKDGYEGDRSE